MTDKRETVEERARQYVEKNHEHVYRDEPASVHSALEDCYEAGYRERDRELQPGELLQQMISEMQLQLTALQTENKMLREGLIKISLGHEFSCAVNDGCRCTCRAGIANETLAKVGKG